MQNFLEKIINNSIISAFIPSFVFVTLIYLLFKPLFPEPLFLELEKVFSQTSYVVIGVAFICGFILYNMNSLIFSLFRGHYFPKGFSFFERKYAERLWLDLRGKEKKLYLLGQKPLEEVDSSELDQLTREQFELAEKYSSIFPPSLNQNIDDDTFIADNIEPTRFGNIIRSCEMYPVMKYGMNSTQLWPRLLHLLPKENADKIEESKNQLSLLLNFSILFFILMFCCSMTAIQQYIGWIQTSVSVHQNNFQLSLVGILIFLLLGILSYIAALPISTLYAKMYCCAFDLYRFLLIEQLKHEIPSNSLLEPDYWYKLSEFLLIGPYKYQTITESDPEKWLEFKFVKNSSKVVSCQRDNEKSKWRQVLDILFFSPKS